MSIMPNGAIPSGYVAPEAERCIVDVEDFKTYMSNMNLNEQQWEAAATVLAGTQQELETYLNRPVQPVRIRQVAQVDLAGYVNLYVTPVWEVLETKAVDGGTIYTNPSAVTLGLDDGTTVADYVHSNYTAGPLLVPGGMFVGYYPSGQVLVDYIGGWDGYNEAGLKLAIMRVAAREMEGRNDDFLSLQGDSASEGSKRDRRDIGWTDDELRRWDRLRRRVMA